MFGAAVLFGFPIRLNLRPKLMAGWNSKKLSSFSHWLQYRVGSLFFPLCEPIFKVLENRDSKINKHFLKAVNSFGDKKTAMALLNLNMVLSLNPNHFLARVYRGRIYFLEGQYNLASKDYLHANKVSPYRFLHYDLYREYFKTVNKEVGALGTSINRNFNQVFEVLRQVQDSKPPEAETDEWMDSLKTPGSVDSGLGEVEEIQVDEPGSRGNNENEKFERLGPITRKEIDAVDWNKLIEKLSS